MDISKIRKKALAKGAEKKPGEGGAAGGPSEDEKRGPDVAPEVVELNDAPQETSPAEEAMEAEIDLTEGLPEEETTAESREELVELLTFSLSQEEYAFRVSEVEEILQFQSITSVPSMADYLLGITSLRGKIIPVIDLKTRLNLQERSIGQDVAGEVPETTTRRIKENKILIIEGPKGLIGAAIDKVIGVVRLPLSEMLQPPGHLDENELKLIEGIVVLDKRFISIIHSGAAMDIETS